MNESAAKAARQRRFSSAGVVWFGSSSHWLFTPLLRGTWHGALPSPSCQNLSKNSYATSVPRLLNLDTATRLAPRRPVVVAAALVVAQGRSFGLVRAPLLAFPPGTRAVVSFFVEQRRVFR